MSIYTDMIPVTVLCNKPVEGLNGAQKENFIPVAEIEVSIYDNDAFKSSQSVKYEQSTHNGCTFYKNLVPGKEYRLIVGMDNYEITSFNTSGRFTTLLMKRTLYAKQ